MEGLGPRDTNANLAAAECPTCGHDTADFDFIVDEHNVVIKIMFECRLCGCLYL